jgi:hypothetical protein
MEGFPIFRLLSVHEEGFPIFRLLSVHEEGYSNLSTLERT